MYNEHEAELKAIVSMRCEQFVHMMKKMVNYVSFKKESIQKVDERVILFTNTVKNVE